jgi:hypothetical protein
MSLSSVKVIERKEGSQRPRLKGGSLVRAGRTIDIYRGSWSRGGHRVIANSRCKAISFNLVRERRTNLSTVRWVRMDQSRLSALLFMFIIAFGKLRKMGQ